MELTYHSLDRSAVPEPVTMLRLTAEHDYEQPVLGRLVKALLRKDIAMQTAIEEMLKLVDESRD